MIEEFRGNQSTNIIGVHVRRTDYKDLLGKNKHFESSQKLLKPSFVNEIFKKVHRYLKSC